jgi:hypothetical protein
MANITVPAALRVKRITWTHETPAQINRSAYTGKRSAVASPWHQIRRAEVELVPSIGEANFRPIRAFLASLRGSLNTFQLPAVENAQHTLGVLNASVVADIGTTVAASPLGASWYRTTKTGGTNGAWDADAVTSVAMTADFTIIVKDAGGVGGFMMGCDVAPLTGSSYSTIDRAISWASGSTLQFLENGGAVGSAGFTLSTDYIILQRVGSAIKVYRNTVASVSGATLLYTFTPSSSTMYFDSSLNPSSASFDAFVLYTQSVPTVSVAGAQGANSLTLAGAPSTLTAGMMATVTLPSGNKQLLLLTSDISGGVITFEPALREAVSVGALVDTAAPTCQVALADPKITYSVEPGQLYSASFAVEEVF